MAVVVAVTVAGCGSGDSTVAKTPEPPASGAKTPQPQAQSPAPPSAPPSAPPTPNDPCAVNLAAPEIAKAVGGLPPDPRSGQAWNAEPLAGNYNECAQLSAIIIRANTNAANPNTRAVMFHQGKFIPT